MALRYQQQQQPVSNHHYPPAPQSTMSRSFGTIGGGYYNLHNCQPYSYPQQPFYSVNRSPAQPSATNPSTAMKCNNSAKIASVSNHLPATAHQNVVGAGQSSARPNINNNSASSSYQWASADQQQLRRIAAVRSHHMLKQQQQQQQHRSATGAGAGSATAARLAYPQQQPLYASVSTATLRNSPAAASIDPWNSSIGYNKPPVFSRPPACQEVSVTKMASSTKSAVQTTKPTGNKIRSTIESLFRGSGYHQGHNQVETVAEATEKQQAEQRKPNKWRSGIRRSLSNLFVNQKQKRSQTAAEQKKTETNTMTDSEIAGINRNTCPQNTGPLVRLRHAEAAKSTQTLSSSSRQSNSIGDGQSSHDSGYSPTAEPEMFLVPHPANNHHQHHHYRSKNMPTSTSMYLHRCSQPNSNAGQADLDTFLDKSMESLDSSVDHRILNRRRFEDVDDENMIAQEAEDEVVLGDWPPPHMRNRAAISSPNIPRLVRRNVAASTGVQRFKPEQCGDQKEHQRDEDEGAPAEVDEELDEDDDEFDDFMDQSIADQNEAFNHHGLSITQQPAAAAGSLCRLTSFNTQHNDLTTGTRQQQLRRPRRIRAVSDHSLHRRSKDQRAQERDNLNSTAHNDFSLQQQQNDHHSLLLSQSALSSVNSNMLMTTSNLVKSATLGALASGHKSRHSSAAFPKILSDVPRAEFNLTASTTFFNKSETNLVDKPANNQQPSETSRPLPNPPPATTAMPKQRPPLPPTPLGSRNSAAIILQSELQQHQQQVSSNLNTSFVYGRPFTIPDPVSSSGMTFEITPIIQPMTSANQHQQQSRDSGLSTTASSVSSCNSGSKSKPLSLNQSLSRISAPPIPSNASASPNSSAASSIENAPAKKLSTLSSSSNVQQKLSTPATPNTSNNVSHNGEVETPGSSPQTIADLQQQEQVFRRFGCQRLLEMQRRIEENCRLSERQQNEQEAVTRLLTNIRRNIRTTEI